MALQFELPGGPVHHITMLNTPMFGAAVPETFRDLMVAMRPDPATGKPDPEQLKAFRARHPDAQPQTDYLAWHHPPASYTNRAFWGIHSFLIVDAKGSQTPVRWQFVPADGERPLTDDELKTAGASFLEDRLVQRARQGPIRRDVVVTVGESGDPMDDPEETLADLAQDPQGRHTECDHRRPAAGRRLRGDQLRSYGDGRRRGTHQRPVLRFRSPAYAASFGKRLSGQ